ILFRDAAAEYLKFGLQGRAPSTIEGRQLAFDSIYVPFLAPKTLAEIKPNDIARVLQHCEKARGNQASTVEGHRTLLKAFFNWAVRNDYIPKNPVRAITPVRAPRRLKAVPSTEDVRAILDAAQELTQRKRPTWYLA